MIEPGITSLQTKVFAQVICTLGTDSKEKQKIESWKLGKYWRSLDSFGGPGHFGRCWVFILHSQIKV
jgi:hypothetical protein